MKSRWLLWFTVLLILWLSPSMAEEKVYKLGDTVGWMHQEYVPDWGGYRYYPHRVELSEESITNGNLRLQTVTCTQPGTAMVYSKEWESHSLNSYWCTQTREIQMEALGHKVKQYTSQTPATCQKNATQTGLCERCNEMITTEIEGTITKCSFTDYVETKAATCVSPAEWTAECDYDCGRVDQKTDPSGKLDDKNHEELVILPAVAPTTMQTGLTEGWKCNACTQIVVPQQIIPVLKASPVPATGDRANPVIWCVLVLMSAVGMSFAVRKTKKI